MIETGFLQLQNIKEQNIIYDDNSFFRFKYDSFQGAYNIKKILQGKLQNPVEKTAELLSSVNNILMKAKDIKKAIYYTTVSTQEFKENAELLFSSFEDEVCELQLADIVSLSSDQKSCFLINLYQIMHFHEVALKRFKQPKELEPPRGFLSSLFRGDKKPAVEIGYVL